MKLFDFLFDPTKELRRGVDQINLLEEEIASLDNNALKAASFELRERVRGGEEMSEKGKEEIYVLKRGIQKSNQA